ncbi:hypothetical protein [Ralstonia pickettii]|uniref:hypothetical protein n=1 Tax=Ralstonia pickettii TaxID=329 RepID=UPI0015BCC046|nr:hypothetical protein [Ralstonia pickettii]NWK43321.1 hypothetical protein [Ralstonia pickettii]
MNESTASKGRMGMAEVLAQVGANNSKDTHGEPDLDALKAAVRAYAPPKKYTAADIVRALFPDLEAKRKEGASPEQLSGLLSENGWAIPAQTLKTLMSTVRREAKIVYVQCPCCRTKVPEAAIAKGEHAEHPNESGSTA